MSVELSMYCPQIHVWKKSLIFSVTTLIARPVAVWGDVRDQDH